MPSKKNTITAKDTSKKTAPKKKTSSKKRAVTSANELDFVPFKTTAKTEYMSQEMREHFKRILLDWRQKLMQEVDRTVDHMKDEASNFADPNDRATQEEEFALELRTRDRERKLIRKIAKTIDRLDDDDYGWCDQCGVEIGVRRLEARPTADLCIDCKTLDEIREKQTRA